MSRVTEKFVTIKSGEQQFVWDRTTDLVKTLWFVNGEARLVNVQSFSTVPFKVKHALLKALDELQ